MRRPPVIALISDFGYRDWYVGVMKAVLLSRCPYATLVDLTHEIPPQDVAAAALVLASALPWLPKQAVALAVVDPGVGTERALIAAEADGRFLVGPDNGLLALALDRSRRKKVVRLTQKPYWQKSISATFHGRDILAPAAALLAAGRSLVSLGPVQRRIRPLSGFEGIRGNRPGGGRVVYVDHFGNCITDLEAGMLKAGERLRVGRRRVRVVKAYAEGRKGEAIALVGSAGLVELAVNQGSAAKRLGIARGAAVTIEHRP